MSVLELYPGNDCQGNDSSAAATAERLPRSHRFQETYVASTTLTPPAVTANNPAQTPSATPPATNGPPRPTARQKFFVEVIKPSHYDDDGYVIQWVRAFIPSNSLACLHAMAYDVQQRAVLGEDVEIIVNTYDETHTIIPTKKIIQRIQAQGGRGFVLLAGVQSNQFPRAVDIARDFRAVGIPVAIGGFHVSGCLSMLPEIPPEMVEAQSLGITMFAGEAEGRLEGLLKDAWSNKLQPIYNYLNDLPDLEGQVTPFLPVDVARRSFNLTAFDVGRGCPFRCSFCTIINVQGRKSRHRNADDVERIVRAYISHGVKKFFITDDNMARNKNWESIFDRLIHLRETEGIKLKLFIQVDTMCHKIPNFIEKAAKAGCNRVFIGMESVSTENLIAAKKFQNRISEYRIMIQAWRKHKVLTHAGYILGFPADTPETIERDIKVLQNELPIDVIEFFILTPLPGSADHQALAAQKVPMETDMNFYDTEHVTTAHSKMSAQEWKDIYDRAWSLYYSDDHVETMMRRAEACGMGATKLLSAVMLYYGSVRFEKLHPLQCGVFRRKVRTTRRSSMPRENPLVFYPRRLWEIVSTYVSMGAYYLRMNERRRKVRTDPLRKQYFDKSMSTVVEDEPLLAAAAAADSCDSCDSGHDHSHGDTPPVTIVPLQLTPGKKKAA